jgi:hypothetical protein
LLNKQPVEKEYSKKCQKGSKMPEDFLSWNEIDAVGIFSD